MISIIGKHKITPFMEFFWSDKGVQLHIAIIRYCLSLYLKSPSVYNEIQKSGILRPPSSRTLRDYNTNEKLEVINSKVVNASILGDELKARYKKSFNMSFLFDIFWFSAYLTLIFGGQKLSAASAIRYSKKVGKKEKELEDVTSHYTESHYTE